MRKLKFAVLFTYIIGFLPFIGPVHAQSITLDPVSKAKNHPITRQGPAVDFFEGALLGNGGLGAVVTTRPDAIVILFGHNNVWDIRIAEDNQDKIGTFKEIFAKVKNIPDSLPTLYHDPWFSKYEKMASANYDKPYPRPFPCGSVLLGFDRREIELIGHETDITQGLCRVNLLIGGKPAHLQILMDMRQDRLWLRLVDDQGNLLPNCFDRIKLIPDNRTPKEFPRYEAKNNLGERMLSFLQILPAKEPHVYDTLKRHPKDKAFRLSARFSNTLEKKNRVDWSGNTKKMADLESGFAASGPFLACFQLEEGLAATLQQKPVVPLPVASLFEQNLRHAEGDWKAYWQKSGVELQDAYLEKIWYWNHYFMWCTVKGGVTAPGLFGNWSYQNIGSAWHGDYHLNYNLQQPFWLPFSSNRLELNQPYVELVEFLLPLSKKWAKEYYQLPGAYFPHSAYPVQMNTMPYPVPTWGWEICETPWAVQGLWWQYLYSKDQQFLRDRAYGPMREAVQFLVAYMQRPEARGKQWGDDKYHIFPTVPPELYGLKPGFKYNYDCLVDLTLTKFVFKAFLEATSVLKAEKSNAALIKSVKEILANFPAYPTAQSRFGKIYVSAPGEHADVVYNTPNSLMTVFPGEEHGIHSSGETKQILENTYRNTQNEGGNELVFFNLQAARLGKLDLDKFKRQIEYCMLPNGTCTDMVLQVHGRYDDNLPFDFMRRMGIWVENFSLPVVINESLMQSYHGTIHLFPNWPAEKDASFSTLRAAGAFLVSATQANRKVQLVEIKSEVGGPVKIKNPWSGSLSLETEGRTTVLTDSVVTLKTRPGQVLILKPASK